MRANTEPSASVDSMPQPHPEDQRVAHPSLLRSRRRTQIHTGNIEPESQSSPPVFLQGEQDLGPPRFSRGRPNPEAAEEDTSAAALSQLLRGFRFHDPLSTASMEKPKEARQSSRPRQSGEEPSSHSNVPERGLQPSPEETRDDRTTRNPPSLAHPAYSLHLPDTAGERERQKPFLVANSINTGHGSVDPPTLEESAPSITTVSETPLLVKEGRVSDGDQSSPFCPSERSSTARNAATPRRPQPNQPSRPMREEHDPLSKRFTPGIASGKTKNQQKQQESLHLPTITGLAPASPATHPPAANSEGTPRDTRGGGPPVSSPSSGGTERSLNPQIPPPPEKDRQHLHTVASQVVSDPNETLLVELVSGTCQNSCLNR